MTGPYGLRPERGSLENNLPEGRGGLRPSHRCLFLRRSRTKPRWYRFSRRERTKGAREEGGEPSFLVGRSRNVSHANRCGMVREGFGIECFRGRGLGGGSEPGSSLSVSNCQSCTWSLVTRSAIGTRARFDLFPSRGSRRNRIFVSFHVVRSLGPFPSRCSPLKA